MSGSATQILVADDNAVDRKILATIVKAAGFEVTEAVDGLDALEKFHSAHPDLVLLDALMPGKDGFDVAEEIKASAMDDFVPIIFLTSLTEATELARCVEAGGDDFLSKPYNKIILEAKLNAFLRMREMHKTAQRQRDEIGVHHAQMLADQEAAKAVFDNVAHSKELSQPFIRHLLSPLALFNGDVVLASRTPANHLCLLLGDFTGHGLAAAIGAMPLADVFYSRTRKGIGLAELMRESNKKLKEVLPVGTFCCAIAVMIDFNRCTVEYWNGGVPSAYMRRKADGKLIPMNSKNLPLGVLSEADFTEETLVLEGFPGDRLFFATDGVIEARNGEQELFGAERLEACISNAPIEQIFHSVESQVNAFMDGRDDDITMVEIEMVTADQFTNAEESNQPIDEYGPRDWKLSYELGPESLKDFNPLPMLQQLLMEAPYLRSRASQIYTVLSELYSNGLEHGVLGLDSRLKNTPDGFAEYYAARAQALEQLKGFVRIELDGQCLRENDEVILRMSVTDSGAGFDFSALAEKMANRDDPQEYQYHGRGIRLLWDLCEEVNFHPPGNKVDVKMQWRLNNYD